MYHHVKQLMYTVRIGEPDPQFGRMLLEQFGGERRAGGGHAVLDPGAQLRGSCSKDLLMDIGTEELSHLEVIGTLARCTWAPHEVAGCGRGDPLIAIAGAAV